MANQMTETDKFLKIFGDSVRNRILAVFLSRIGKWSVEDVHVETEIKRTSVYNTMTSLCKAGMLARKKDEFNIYRYSLNVKKEEVQSLIESWNKISKR